MRLRKVADSDIMQIVAIERDAFPGDPWSEELLQLAAEHESTVFLVAEEDKSAPDGDTQRQPKADKSVPDGDTQRLQKADGTSQIAGYVVLRTVAGEGNIDNVCVTETFRRNRLASELLTAAMEEARARYGAEAFTLEVRVSNTAARALYESLGFVCEGTRPGYYDTPKEDAYIYWIR